MKIAVLTLVGIPVLQAPPRLGIEAMVAPRALAELPEKAVQAA
jgi:hypothetical protein